jgi:hypothetical protein
MDHTACIWIKVEFKCWPLPKYHTYSGDVTHRASGDKLHFGFYSDEWSVSHSIYFAYGKRRPVAMELKAWLALDPVWKHILPRRDVNTYPR